MFGTNALCAFPRRRLQITIQGIHSLTFCWLQADMLSYNINVIKVERKKNRSCLNYPLTVITGGKGFRIWRREEELIPVWHGRNQDLLLLLVDWVTANSSTRWRHSSGHFSFQPLWRRAHIGTNWHQCALLGVGFRCASSADTFWLSVDVTAFRATQPQWRPYACHRHPLPSSVPTRLDVGNGQPSLEWGAPFAFTDFAFSQQEFLR